MKTYKAINIYTHAEDVFTVEGAGRECVYVASAGDRWCAEGPGHREAAWRT